MLPLLKGTRGEGHLGYRMLLHRPLRDQGNSALSGPPLLAFTLHYVQDWSQTRQCCGLMASSQLPFSQDKTRYQCISTTADYCCMGMATASHAAVPEALQVPLPAVTRALTSGPLLEQCQAGQPALSARSTSGPCQLCTRPHSALRA